MKNIYTVKHTQRKEETMKTSQVIMYLVCLGTVAYFIGHAIAFAVTH